MESRRIMPTLWCHAMMKAFGKGSVENYAGLQGRSADRPANPLVAHAFPPAAVYLGQAIDIDPIVD
jgi:hypothetical protein